MPWLEPDPARRKNAAKQEAGAEGEDLLSWTSHGPAQGENLAKQGRDIENINPLKQREPVPEHPRERSGQRRPRSQARRQIMTQAGAYFPQEDFPRTAPPSPSPKTRLALTLGLIALVIALVTWGGIWLSGYIQEQNLLRAERLRLEELAREKARHPYPAEYRGLIEDYAREQGVDPALVAAMVLNESSFKPEAESRLGARGLMQLMYDTCDWVAGKLNEPFDFDRMYDPETNIRFGCWFLGYLSRKFDGDPVKMVAGYHAGGGAVDAWESNPAYVQNGQLVAFPESYESTERYVKKVMTAYEMYIKHYYTVEEEPQPQD